MSHSRLGALAAGLAVLSMLSAPPALAQAVGKSVATVAERALPAEVKRSGQTDWAEIEDGGEVLLGDTLRTGEGGRLKIVFNDKSIMILAENTLLEITQHVYDPAAKERTSLFKLYEGKVRAIVGELFGAQSRFEIETPVAVAGVKGTDFETHHPKPCSTVYTQLGDSYARNVNPAVSGDVVVPGGFMTTICEGAKPTDPVEASEEFLEGTIPLRGLDTTRPGTPPMDGFPPLGPDNQLPGKPNIPPGPQPNIPPTSTGGLPPGGAPVTPPPPRPIVNNTMQ
ncbi:MAG: FecR family protein [Deltaproteobacteria bacterium]|nr:FecR family protein [Deltaproteobacteria bacterium]